MNNTFEQLTNFFDKAYGLPGAVMTLFFCIGLGYFLKMLEVFPNKRIPVFVVCWGMLWNVLLRPPPPANVAPWQHYCRLIAVGFMIGLAACLLYDRIREYVPWLGNLLSNSNGDDKPTNAGEKATTDNEKTNRNIGGGNTAAGGSTPAAEHNRV